MLGCFGGEKLEIKKNLKKKALLTERGLVLMFKCKMNHLG